MSTRTLSPECGVLHLRAMVRELPIDCHLEHMSLEFQMNEQNALEPNSSPSKRAPTANAVTSQSFLAKHQTLINFYLDSFLLLNFLALVWVGVVVRFVFPRAGAASGYSLWRLSLSQWMDIQFNVLAIFCLGIGPLMSI